MAITNYFSESVYKDAVLTFKSNIKNTLITPPHDEEALIALGFKRLDANLVVGVQVWLACKVQ
jgi:hypothetical protein